MMEMISVQLYAKFHNIKVISRIKYVFYNKLSFVNINYNR